MFSEKIKHLKTNGLKIAWWILAISVCLLVLSAIAIRVIIDRDFSFATGEMIYSIFYVTIFVTLYTSAFSFLYLLYRLVKKLVTRDRT